MQESCIEMQLRKAAERAGGRAFKFVSPGVLGVPDRIVILPGGAVAFVEVKAPWAKPRPSQRLVLRRLYRLGVRVATVDNKRSAEGLVRLLGARYALHSS